jgi:DNA-binding transcriptional LysR family regulator
MGALEVSQMVLLSNLAKFVCIDCAADAMGLSSVDARRSLHDIEGSTGLRVLERREGRVALTSAGASLVEQARRRLEALRSTTVNRASGLLRPGPGAGAFCRCDHIAEALRCVYGFPED